MESEKTNKSSNTVALVISIAYPEAKFQNVYQKFITLPEEALDNYLLEDIYNLITRGYDPETIKSITGIEYIENFWSEYYKYLRMNNKPWSAMVWKNGEWISQMPSNEEIWKYVQMKGPDPEYVDIDEQTGAKFYVESDSDYEY